MHRKTKILLTYLVLGLTLLASPAAQSVAPSNVPVGLTKAPAPQSPTIAKSFEPAFFSKYLHPTTEEGLNFEAMEAKAEDYLERIQQYHTPYGQILTAMFQHADPDGDGEIHPENVGSAVSRYTTHPDSAGFTGIYAAALAYRCAVLQTTEACDLAKEAVNVLHRLHRVTGISGTLARSYKSSEDCGAANCELGDSGIQDKHGVHASPTYSGYEYMGDITRDQYSGWMFGLVTAFDLIFDEDTRETIRSDIKAFVDQLMDNNYLINQEGKPSLAFSPSLYPVMVLSHLRAAYHVTGEDKYKEEFENKASLWMWKAKDWLPSAEYLFTYDCDFDEEMDFDTGYYIFHIGALPLFNALRITTTPEIRDDWETVMYRLWNGNSHNFDGVNDHKNTLFDIIRLVGGNDGKYDFDVNDSDSVSSTYAKQIFEQLNLFPAGPRYKIPTEKDFTPKSGCDNVSVDALDSNERYVSEYLWQRSPFYPTYPGGYEAHKISSGVDYLIVYWMARYYGFFRQPKFSVEGPVEMVRYREGSTARIKLKVDDWIPDDRWEIDWVGVSLKSLKGTTAKYKTVTLTHPLSVNNPEEIIQFDIPPELEGTKFKFELFFNGGAPGRDSASQRQIDAVLETPNFIINRAKTVYGEMEETETLSSDLLNTDHEAAASYFFDKGDGLFKVTVEGQGDASLFVRFYSVDTSGGLRKTDPGLLTSSSIGPSGKVDYYWESAGTTSHVEGYISSDKALLVTIQPASDAAAATYKITVEGEYVNILDHNEPYGYRGCFDSDSEDNLQPGQSTEFLFQVPSQAIVGATIQSQQRAVAIQRKAKGFLKGLGKFFKIFDSNDNSGNDYKLEIISWEEVNADTPSLTLAEKVLSAHDWWESPSHGTRIRSRVSQTAESTTAVLGAFLTSNFETNQTLAVATSSSQAALATAAVWNTETVPIRYKVRVTNEGNKSPGFCLDIKYHEEYPELGTGLWDEMIEPIAQPYGFREEEILLWPTFPTEYHPVSLAGSQELTVEYVSAHRSDDSDYTGKVRLSLFSTNNLYTPIVSGELAPGESLSVPAGDEERIFIMATEAMEMDILDSNDRFYATIKLTASEPSEETDADEQTPNELGDYEWITLSDFVLDKYNLSAIAGATISVTNTYPYQEGGQHVADNGPVTSDATGRYEMQFQVTGSGWVQLFVTVEKEGYETLQDFVYLNTQEPQASAEFRLEPSS